MKAKKVLFITQEIVPYVEESEIAINGKKLPVSAQEAGKEVRIFMPKWGMVNERRNQLHEVIRLSGMNLIINDTDHPLIIKVASMQSSRVQVYFIDNDDYFMKRLRAEDADGNEYPDNGERAIFYTRGTLETVKKLRWCPDVIVCQGWMGALVPFYIKTLYADEPSFRDSKIVYLAQSEELKNDLGADFYECLSHKNLDENAIDKVKKASYKYQDLMQMATDFSDGIILGSNNISEEIKAVFTQSEKPVLSYPSEEEFAAACNNFYDEVFSIGKNEE